MSRELNLDRRNRDATSVAKQVAGRKWEKKHCHGNPKCHAQWILRKITDW